MTRLKEKGWINIPVNDECFIRLFHYDKEDQAYEGIDPKLIKLEKDLYECNLVISFIKYRK